MAGGHHEQSPLGGRRQLHQHLAPYPVDGRVQRELLAAGKSGRIGRRCQVLKDDEGIAAAALYQGPEVVRGYRDLPLPCEPSAIVVAEAR